MLRLHRGHDLGSVEQQIGSKHPARRAPSSSAGLFPFIMAAWYGVAGLAKIFLIFACSALLIYVGLLRLWRRNRPRAPGDAVLTLAVWHPMVSAAVSFTLQVGLVLPILFFVVAFGFGGILASLEGWDFDDGFCYVISNMSNTSPLVDLTPASQIGIAMDILMSMYSFILANAVLGLGASLGLSNASTFVSPTSHFGLMRMCALHIPLLLLLLGAGTGGFLALLEGWSFSDGLTYMMRSICGIQDPLGQASPTTHKGVFFDIFCNVVQLCIGGMLIGVLGAHMSVGKYIAFIEGEIDPATVFSFSARPSLNEQAGDGLAESDLVQSNDRDTEIVGEQKCSVEGKHVFCVAAPAHQITDV